MGRNYLPIPKLQRWNRWSLRMHKYFLLTVYWIYDYWSMLGSKLNHVSKRGHCSVRDCPPSHTFDGFNRASMMILRESVKLLIFHWREWTECIITLPYQNPCFPWEVMLIDGVVSMFRIWLIVLKYFHVFSAKLITPWAMSTKFLDT